MDARLGGPNGVTSARSASTWKPWTAMQIIMFGATPATVTAATANLLAVQPARPQLHSTSPTHQNPPRFSSTATERSGDKGIMEGASAVILQDVSGGQDTLNAAANTQQAGENVEGQVEEEETQQEEDAATVVDPPETTLPYKISPDLFQKARNAIPDTPESFWSYAMYRKVEDATEAEAKETTGEAASSSQTKSKADDGRVKVHYCKSKLTTERVCQQHFLNEPVLGFDLEWVPGAWHSQGARRNVCLVQLASPSRIGLFHLSLYPKAVAIDIHSEGENKDADELVAPTLKKILEDPDVLKLGVAIKGDCTRLRRFLEIDTRGSFELSHLHRLVKYSQSGEIERINKVLVSLADQVQEHLRLPMFKGSNVRSSDWSKPLRMDQIIYSASDAYSALQIFSVLEKQRNELDPTPPRPAHADLNKPIMLASGMTATSAAKAAAAEEAEEEAAEEVAVEEADDGNVPALSLEQSEAVEHVQFEADSDEPAITKATIAAETANAPPPTPKASKPPKDPRVEEAERWIEMYREEKTTMLAKPANLRAYKLWYTHDDLDPAAVAALLRTPPLKTNTVTGYILEAIRLEKLPYNKERLRSELLEQIPSAALVMRRYYVLAKACNYKPPP